MGAALAIRRDLLSADDLRTLARRERNRRTATRMLAIANALDGMSRTQAARLVGLERQALRDAVLRFNAEGLTGLRDRLKPGRPPTLSQAEPALLRAKVLQRPSAEEGGRDWTLPRLVRLDREPLGQAPAPGQLVAAEAWAGPVAACCQAFNALTPERLRSLTNQPWIQKVTS